MALGDITRESVLEAIGECDRLGRDAFLRSYGRGRALEYRLLHDGREYDSKAIADSAHKFATGKTLGDTVKAFTGGQKVARRLERLGFEITWPGIDPPAVGAVLRNADIMARFGVGVSGGMRLNKRLGHQVLFSDPFKGLYDDRWEGRILHYTGTGKVGDQNLEGPNLTLAQSTEVGGTVHVFEALEPKAHTYVGVVELVGEPYQDTQPDAYGNARLVWIFPLRPRAANARPTPNAKQVEIKTRWREHAARKMSRAELRRRAAAAKGQASRRTVTSEQISRDQNVVKYVKDEANGHCDLCAAAAPFKKKNGEAYLECHHLEQLAVGGEDAISNAVALCPNCHRKMHSLKRSIDMRKLKKRISVRDA